MFNVGSCFGDNYSGLDFVESTYKRYACLLYTVYKKMPLSSLFLYVSTSFLPNSTFIIGTIT